MKYSPPSHPSRGHRRHQTPVPLWQPVARPPAEHVSPAAAIRVPSPARFAIATRGRRESAAVAVPLWIECVAPVWSSAAVLSDRCPNRADARNWTRDDASTKNAVQSKCDCFGLWNKI